MVVVGRWSLFGGGRYLEVVVNSGLIVVLFFPAKSQIDLSITIYYIFNCVQSAFRFQIMFF